MPAQVRRRPPRVRRVYSDGSALVEHYNFGGDRRYAVSRMRAPRCLYVGVAGPR